MAAMSRTGFVAGVAGVTVAMLAASVEAGAPGPPRTILDKLVHSQVVVTGKVTNVGADTVLAEWTPGDKRKVEYKVATIKIETGIVGAEKMTHVRVGFQLPPKVDPNVQQPWRRGPFIELKEGQQLLLYLAKHPTADFYVASAMNPPADTTSDLGKKEVEAVKRFTAAIADPMKGLKSENAEVRAQSATLLIVKYRAIPDFGGDTKELAIAAAESKLILRALAEAAWTEPKRPFGLDLTACPTPMQAFYQLYLNERDGWTPPNVKPGDDYNAIHKAAFVKWLDNAGKDYVLKKIVPKNK